MSTRVVQDGGGTSSKTTRPTERVVIALPPLLADPALKTAERWAARVMWQMQVESRRICGGWPGTVTEARTLVAGDLLSQLTGKSLGELERVGHDRVARFLYQGAREYWTRRELRCRTKHDRADSEGDS